MRKVCWALSVLLFLVVLAPFFLLAMVAVLLSWPMTQLLFWWTPLALIITAFLVLWYYDSYHRTREEPIEDDAFP
jgi:amino acid transporter